MGSSSNNLSHNLGAEGPTEDAGIVEARRRRVRGMLATLALSQGVPMILAGDEFGQTQGGNNNAYCQDNETTWLAWDKADQDLITAVSDLLLFRKENGLSRASFAQGEGEAANAMIAKWHHPRGGPMTDEDWQADELSCIMLELFRPDQPNLLICLNAAARISAALPKGAWTKRIDTSLSPLVVEEPAEGSVELDWQSLAVFLGPSRPC